MGKYWRVFAPPEHLSFCFSKGMRSALSTTPPYFSSFFLSYLTTHRTGPAVLIAQPVQKDYTVLTYLLLLWKTKFNNKKMDFHQIFHQTVPLMKWKRYQCWLPLARKLIAQSQRCRFQSLEVILLLQLRASLFSYQLGNNWQICQGSMPVSHFSLIKR